MNQLSLPKGKDEDIFQSIGDFVWNAVEYKWIQPTKKVEDEGTKQTKYIAKEQNEWTEVERIQHRQMLKHWT